MFRRRAFTHHRSAKADLPLFTDGNQRVNRLATQISVRTQRHCRLAPTNLSAKG
ncbi:MAG: hypothetical protein LBC02_07700 [Planctomycetaceae bacterium]|nr:hypothetical protein [Planctomycetaceae bacterium]